MSLFENMYFVNKLYIVKYVFLHRLFSYTLNFLVQFQKRIIYLVKKFQSGSLPSLYNAICLYVEASHESCTENLEGRKMCCHCSMFV